MVPMAVVVVVAMVLPTPFFLPLPLWISRHCSPASLEGLPRRSILQRMLRAESCAALCACKCGPLALPSPIILSVLLHYILFHV